MTWFQKKFSSTQLKLECFGVEKTLEKSEITVANTGCNNTARGASSPANPALTIPLPLSTTNACEMKELLLLLKITEEERVA